MPHRHLLFSVISVWVLAAGGCDLLTGAQQPKASWSKIPLDEQVTDAYTGFGFDLFRKVRAADPNGNVFVSPTSAAFALTMTYNGANGLTAEEMARALGVGELDVERLNETNRVWLTALRETGDPRAELAIANAIWHRQSHPLVEAFRERVRTTYEAAIEPITSAAAINSWVEESTRGRIDGIVEGEIPGNVVAYLINAVYFKADWTHRFDRSKTREVPFRRAAGSTVSVPMMFRQGAVEARSDPDFEMVRLPYGAGRFSMILALPGEGRDLGTIARELEAESWRGWMQEFVESPDLTVGVPRFEIEWESSLVESLQAMGMEVAFEPGVADFSGMFGRQGPWIDEVLQKTYLKVDEEGTEAAAVTSVVMVERAADQIVFDRPFFLAIYDHATETVLFLGQVTDPS